MAQAQALVAALKQALKRQGKTYADVAMALDVAESSVKRLFASRRLSLDRIDRICEMLGIELSDLLVSLERQAARLDQLSEEAEAALADDERLLLLAVCLLNHMPVRVIIDRYAIDELEAVRLLARLDRMRIIELQPGNRVKLLLSSQFRWRRDGPIERLFRAHVQQEFFASSFDGAGEYRVVLNGVISQASNALIRERMARLADAFDEASREDRRIGLDQRLGTTLVLAMRPWEPDMFARLRRDRVDRLPSAGRTAAGLSGRGGRP